MNLTAGRLGLTGRHREQQVPRLYLGWQHVLGLVGCWVQKTVKEWTVPQGVTRQELAMMCRGDFVLAGPTSLNLRAMAVTALSLHPLPARNGHRSIRFHIVALVWITRPFTYKIGFSQVLERRND